MKKRNILGICLQMILDILKQKKKFFETNISFQTTLKNYYEMGGNTLVLFSHFYQN